MRNEEIKRLLEAGMDPNWQSPTTNTTALHNLCQKIEPDRVFATDKKSLIDHLLNMTGIFIQAGANLNARDKNGMTPLHIAILALRNADAHERSLHQESLRFIQYLLDQGACTYQQDNKDFDALKHVTDVGWMGHSRYPQTRLPEVKEVIDAHRKQVESFRNEVRKTKDYPFIEHARGNRPLSAGFIKSAIIGTDLEERADWQDYITYELLIGKPYKQGNQHPNYANNLGRINRSELPVDYENLQAIARYYQ